MEELRDQRLTFIRRELDQIGVAVSIMGTSRVMLKKLHGYGEELRDSLHGTRESVRRLHGDLTRALHSLKRANPRDAKVASRAIWNVRDLADRLIKLRRRISGLSAVEPEMKMGRLRFDNVYGYARKEILAAERVLRSAVEIMGEWGLFRRVVYGDVVLDPSDTSGKFVVYLAGLDALAMDPSLWGQGRVFVYSAFSDRIWLTLLENNQREVWGSGLSGWKRFTDAFVAALDGGGVSADTWARLAVTMAKVTKSRRWVSAVA